MPPFESLEADRVAPERCSPLARGAARTVPWEVRRACESIDSEAGGHARSFASQRCVVSPDSLERRSSGSARDRLQRLLCPSNGRRDRVGGPSWSARPCRARPNVPLASRSGRKSDARCVHGGGQAAAASFSFALPRLRRARQGPLRRGASRNSEGQELASAARAQPTIATITATIVDIASPAQQRGDRVSPPRRGPRGRSGRVAQQTFVFARRDRRPCGRGYYASLPPASQLMGRYGDICLTRNITTAVTPK